MPVKSAFHLSKSAGQAFNGCAAILGKRQSFIEWKGSHPSGSVEKIADQWLQALAEVEAM